MIHFLSDTHFHHANILNYCPWRKQWATDLDEMHHRLMSGWNAVVDDADLVYFLGDFSFGTEEQITAIRKQLKGRIFLALVNHDQSKAKMLRCGFDSVEHYFKLEIDGLEIGMIHDPSRFRPEQFATASMLLHGHHHGTDHHKDDGILKLPVSARQKLFDVGVDALLKTRPVTLDEIKCLFSERPPWLKIPDSV